MRHLNYLVKYAFVFFLKATNEVISRVPKATQQEMLAAVDSCARAFRTWSETSILARQQVFLRYQQLIKDNIVSQRIKKCKVQLITIDYCLVLCNLICWWYVKCNNCFDLSHISRESAADISKTLAEVTLNLQDWHEGHLVFQKELAKSITVEQGKTLADAEGDVFRGLRKFYLTHACAHTCLLQGMANG